MTDIRPSLEVIAPTVEEAVTRGAAELGVAEADLEVQILDEGSRGLLGIGSRQARIRVSVRDDEGEAGAPPRQRETAAAPAERVRPESDAIEGDETLKIAKDTVAELLLRMGVEADIQASWGETSEGSDIRPLHVDVHGDDLSIVIGRRGETLSALQYITRLIVGKELKSPVAVVIDIEGYRKRREQQLRRLAQRVAEQTAEQERMMTLEPMPAYERRIIHIELRDHPKVYTESVGEGDQRKVTIVPKR